MKKQKKSNKKLWMILCGAFGVVALAAAVTIPLVFACNRTSNPISYEIDGSPVVEYGNTVTITASSKKIEAGKEFSLGIKDDTDKTKINELSSNGLEISYSGEYDETISIHNINTTDGNINVQNFVLFYGSSSKNIKENFIFKEDAAADLKEMSLSIYNTEFGDDSNYVSYGYQLVITATTSHLHENNYWKYDNDFDNWPAYIIPSFSASPTNTLTLSLSEDAPADVEIPAGSITCTNEDVVTPLDQTITFEKKFVPFVSPQQILVKDSGNGDSKTYEIYDSTDLAFATLLCNSASDSTSITFRVIDGDTFADEAITKSDILGVTFSGNTAKDNVEIGTTDVSLNNIGDNFLQNCTSFDSPLAFPYTLVPIDSYGKAIGDNFMNGCTSFNKPLLFPNGIDGKIGTNFMQGCTTFDHSLSLQGNCTEIGAHFMEGCLAFNQNIGLPTGLTLIDDYFLTGCALYNKTISIPSGVKNIKDYFLSGCVAYNEEISMPDGLLGIGKNFLDSCTAYNQVINLGNSLNGIGQNFLNGCIAYDSDLTLPNSLITIASGFIHNCNAMTRTISFGAFNANGLIADDLNFSTEREDAPCYTQMIRITGENAEVIKQQNQDRDASPFRRLNIPNQTASITLTNGTQYYLSDSNANISASLCSTGWFEPSASSTVTVNTVALGALTVKRSEIKGLVFNANNDNSLTKIGKYFLDNCTSFNSTFVLPNSVTDIDDCFMKNCSSFNSYIYFPNNSALDEIEASFMEGCKAFNKPLKLPSQLRDIGSIFMSGCQSFNQQLNIPRSVNSLDGDNFLSNCYNFTSTVCFMDMGTGIFKNMQLPTTFLAMDKDCPASTKGIHIKGTQRAAIHNKYKDADYGIAGGKRKLLETQCNVKYSGDNETMDVVEDDNYVANMITTGNGTIHTCTGGVESWNQPYCTHVDFGNDGTLVSIPDYFLANNPQSMRYGANFADGGVLVLPNSVTTIGDYFMQSDLSWDPPALNLMLPNTITSIGSGFMVNSKTFNCVLNIPNVKTIGAAFLMNCTGYDQSITIPSTITSIGQGMMYGCWDYSTKTDPFSVIDLSNVSGINVFTTLDDPTAFSAIGSGTSPSYTNGIHILVKDVTAQTAFQEQFPDISDGGMLLWRHFIVDIKS